MTTISPQQAFQRYKTLSPKIKEVFLSEQSAEVVRITCEENHLPKEKNSSVAKALGLVILGYIHPGDLAKEIEEQATLSSQSAQVIANSLDAKVISPIRNEVEKLYAPLPRDHELEAAPKPIVEIKPFDITPAPAEASTFSKLSADKSASKQSKPPAPFMPPAAPKMVPKTEGFKPIEVNLAETSPFSKPIGEIKPPVAPSFIKTSEGKPTPFKIGLPPTPSSPVSSSPALRSLGEVGEPPPVIFHEETSLPPLRSTREFRIETPMQKLSEVKPSAPPPKPAILEFGPSFAKASEDKGAKPFDAAQGRPLAVPTPPSLKPEEKVRVVHYTEMRTPIEKPAEKTPMLPTGHIEHDREIKEITGETLIPKPPIIPKPPAPPKPIS